MGVSVNDGVYTRRDVQLRQAHAKCAAAFSKQHQACTEGFERSHDACESLEGSVPTGMVDAMEKARKECAAGMQNARQECQDHHKNTQMKCHDAWLHAQAVATPELVAAVSDASQGAMSKALATCTDLRSKSSSACRHDAKLAYAACGGQKKSAPKCSEALGEARESCEKSHADAQGACEKAYEAARNANVELVQDLVKKATATALQVAADARAVGIERDVAKRAVDKAIQDAMVVLAHGGTPEMWKKTKEVSLAETRETIRHKMADVVDGVQGVWRQKMRGSIEAAAEKATTDSRAKGENIQVTRAAAVDAAKEAADELQGMAKQAELKGGARVMGPEVEKLVNSKQEQERRKFQELAQPYLVRADALLKKMEHEQAKERVQKKITAKKVAKHKAHALKKSTDELMHKKMVAASGQWLAHKTEEVATAGDKVSVELARIAKEAQLAADQVSDTIATEGTIDIMDEQY